jgi:dihydropyrimidinase
VRGGQVVTSSEAYEASVAIRGEKIVAIAPDELLPSAAQYIDASGKYVLPGAIDCHVHLGGHDDYLTGGIAAAHAGLTTIIPFALYDLAHRETLPEAIKRHNKEVGKVSVVDFAWHFILNNDPYIFEGLSEALHMGVSS